MSAVIETKSADLRTELVNWKERLEATESDFADRSNLRNLLREVEATLERLGREDYGICQNCHRRIGARNMSVDPLARNCPSCFTPEQLEELERDLDRAWLVQGELLPKQNLKFNGWEVFHHYEPAGRVGGDYCDLVSTDEGDLYFLLGDVSGKGIAASLLMGRLHAIFRSLIGNDLSVKELVERANRIFAETTMRPYYATLVCGKAEANGNVEVCNAGHCPPLALLGANVKCVAATGLPLGMFGAEHYSAARFQLNKGDRLLLYTDGLTEACDHSNEEYGEPRVQAVLENNQHLQAQPLIDALVKDVRRHSSGLRLADDLTLMAIEMVGH